MSGRAQNLPPVEDKEDTEHEAGEPGSVVPFQFLAQIGDGKSGEDHQRDDLLDGLELRGRELERADTVGGHLEAIFEESDTPAGQNDLPQSFAAIFEVAIPGKGHEDVRNGQQQYRPHVALGILSGVALNARI
jgi:hypothetical protein